MISTNEKIKKIRITTGQNQSAFLEMLGGGMDTSTLSKMENGAEVSFELVLRIVTMFKNCENYLFGWSDDFPDVSVQCSTPEAINTMLGNLEIGNRLRFVALRCGISAKEMGDIFGCSVGMVNRYWARETMPKFEYVKAFLSADNYRKYDAFLLGITDKMPTEPSDGIAVRLRRVAARLERTEGISIDKLHEYLDACTGTTGLTDGMMKKVLSGVAQLPVSALYNLAKVQQREDLALYILGMKENLDF